MLKLLYDKISFKKMSVNATKQLILELAQSDDPEKFGDIDDVIQLYIDQGYSGEIFNKTVEKCRNFHEGVPLVEDVLGGSFSAACELGKFNGKTLLPKQEIGQTIEAPGIIAFSPYMHSFNYSLSRLYTGIEIGIIQDIQTAIVFGVASIEAFINEKAQIWNDNYPNDNLNDSKEMKVGFDDKIDFWIPKFTGIVFDKSQRFWEDFKVLQRYRDNEIIHQRGFSIGIEYNDIILKANKYKHGIAGTLKYLLQLFDQKIPQRIIRATYLPEICISDDFQYIGQR
ncbi:MAG: hypothetical protein ABIE74_03285 [Pseudomonadota bacterium]